MDKLAINLQVGGENASGHKIQDSELIAGPFGGTNTTTRVTKIRDSVDRNEMVYR